MPYQSETIATIVNRLNIQYFLPAIQREFVWQPKQIIRLFDSIMRGYPISSFLFWELKPENRDKWDIYKFVDNFSQRTPHNQPGCADGVQQLTLILDGQQRLTSLLIALKGSYTTKKPRLWWNNPDAWVTQRLYLDLLKDPKIPDPDDEDGIHYGFQFVEAPPPDGNQYYWFRVGKILDFDSEERFADFKFEEKDRLPDTTTKAQTRVFEQNLETLLLRKNRRFLFVMTSLV